MLGEAEKRRKLIENATALIRVSRGRGLIISSEAYSILACRAPADIVNLAAVGGLGQERGVEAVTTEARKAVVTAQLKRTSYRGVIDVVYGGERPVKEKLSEGIVANGKAKNKRKAVEMNTANEKLERPMSKRQMKRIAHEKAKGNSGTKDPVTKDPINKEDSGTQEDPEIRQEP